MDQDLRSRIKAAAQERGIDPEIAVKFAQAESSLNPNAKAKTSSASGLYQVINKTWKEYGGGDKRDVDEQIRVGTDVIASNQEKFKRKFNREPSAAELYAYHVLGPTGAPQLLRADPNTPMDQVVSPEALKANSVWKGKTVGQVLATYEKKVGGSGKAPAVTAQTKPGMRPTNYSFDPLTRMDLEQLGPNYQAAMASIALADTNDSDVPTAEQIADMEEDQVMAQDESMVEEEPMMSTAAIRDIGNTQSQPIFMANGGEARKMLDAVYRAEGSPEEGETSSNFVDDALKKVTNMVVGAGIKGYGAIADRSSMPSNKRIYLESFADEKRTPITEKNFTADELKTIGEIIKTKHSVNPKAAKGSIKYEDYEKFMSPLDTSIVAGVSSGERNPYENIRTTLGQFNYKVDPKTGNAVISDVYDFNKINDKLSKTMNRGDYVVDTLNPYSIARIYGEANMPVGKGRPVTVQIPGLLGNPAPVRRAEGSPEYGEISMGDFSGDTRQQLRDAITKRGRATTKEDLRLLKQIPVQTASNLESVARGSIAGDLGLPGEIEAAFTDPRADSQAFPTKSGTQGRKETFFPTTERILKNIPRITPTNDRTEGYEELGTYVGLGPLGYAAGKAPAAIKAAAPKVAEAMANATVPKLLKPVVQPELLQPMNIMTPSGRVFLANKTAAEEPISLLDTHIKDTMSWVNLGRDPAAKPASDFLDTKVRAYFKNNAGTVNDEVREALLTGRIKIPKDSPLEEEFPKALIDAARKGDVTAMKILETKLNAESGMISSLRTKEYASGEIQAAESSNDTRLAILGQMKNNPNLIPDAMLLRLIGKDVTTLPTKEAAEKVAEIRAKLKENPTLFNTIFEDKIGRLIPDNLVKSVTEESAANYPRLYPSLNKAASKQEGIMALQQNAPITDIGINSPRILGLTLRQLMQGAQDIPAKELERMSVADVVGRVLPMQMKLNEAEGMAAKVKKSLASGNPIPEKIATFGTEVTIPADKQGFVWRKIVDPNAAKVQAAFLNNSIGGYAENGTYGSIEKGMSALKKGEVELYSLYNPKGEVVTNVEYITPKATGRKIDEGIVKPNTITQFFGNGVKTGNVSPEDYVYQAENLVRHLNPSNVPNTIKELFRANNISFAK
jgi:hypothetical protein